MDYINWTYNKLHRQIININFLFNYENNFINQFLFLYIIFKVRHIVNFLGILVI